MAYIKTLKDNELVGGTDDTEVYPVSHTKAIFDGNNKELDQRLEENDDDRELLHRQAEKLVLSYNSNKSEAQEITATPIIATITAEAVTETYGDEPTVYLLPENYTYSFTNAEVASITGSQISTITTLPSVVGAYTSTFNVTYNGVSKSTSVTSYMNLRKYFGFSESEPSDVTTLDASHFSNSVGCTVTIPAKSAGERYKNIYFAVPSGMTISDVRQPDALNAPLAFQYVKEVYRTISGTTYSYKLYKSTDLIDSTVSKRLTIS